MHSAPQFIGDVSVSAPDNRPKRNVSLKCNCDLHSPSCRVLRSVEFNHHLAKRIMVLSMSGDATIDLVLCELLDHRTGKLIGPDGQVLPIESSVADDVEWFDGLFSEDQRRFINRYKARSNEIGFKNRLQGRLVKTVALIFLAMEIRDCRTAGQCSRRA